MSYPNLFLRALSTGLLTISLACAQAPDPAPTASVATALATPTAAAETLSAEVVAIQNRWAEIKYQLPENQRVAAFEALANQAGQLSAAHPEDLAAKIWHGIVLSTWAGERGGMGALKIAKQALAVFEQAIAKDPSALSGSALTSLGSLYHGVPGWPIGFGDDEKAEQLLKQGIAKNPNGIDSNFFLGQYLMDEDRYQEAERAFNKALAAAPRPGRELADQGRRAEIAKLLAKVRAELQG